MGTIIHGNKNFGYATISSSTFGTPVMMPGLVSIEVELDQDTTNIYADDVVYAAFRGAKARTATANFRFVTSAYAELLGFHINDNGGVSDSGSHASHCIFWTTEIYDSSTSSTTTRLHYLYNVTGGEPSLESSTDEDEIEAQEIEVEYSALNSDFVVDDDGETLQYYYIDRTTNNATVFDTYTTTVLLPTTTMTSN